MYSSDGVALSPWCPPPSHLTHTHRLSSLFLHSLTKSQIHTLSNTHPHPPSTSSSGRQFEAPPPRVRAAVMRCSHALTSERKVKQTYGRQRASLGVQRPTCITGALPLCSHPAASLLWDSSRQHRMNITQLREHRCGPSPAWVWSVLCVLCVCCVCAVCVCLCHLEVMCVAWDMRRL